MRYLLDTTVVIPVLAGDHHAIDLVGRLAPDGIAVSILSYLEAYQGVIQSDRRDAAERVFAVFFAETPIVSITDTVARRCAEMRVTLKRQGKNPRRRAFDLVIAATALELGLELVTHNTKDFADIPQLVLYRL